MIRSVIVPVHGITRPTVCHHCPFRKDRPFWLDLGRKLINMLRLKMGKQQHCHMARASVCRGLQVCRDGGNAQVLSMAEFIQQRPCPREESIARYTSA